MRSLHIIGSRLLGGAESFYMRLVLGLRDAGEDVSVACRGSSLVARELAGKVPQVHAPMAGPWDVWSRWRLKRAIQSYRPDIVQTYMTRATVLTHVPPGKGVVHVARLGGYYKVDRFRHAHAWIGNTKGICDFLIQHGLPAERVFYIGNFVEPPAPVSDAARTALRQGLQLPADAWVVLAAGRMVAKKGFDTLLAAFAALPGEIAGRVPYLLILGDGPLRQSLQQQAQTLGSADRVRWAGWQTAVAPYFDLADVFVCPSRHEPLGNVILEGWTYQRAVISTATVGAMELIEPGRDGVLVPVDEPAAMAQALETMLHDDDLRQALADAGATKARAAFSREAIVAQYVDLYRRLAGR